MTWMRDNNEDGRWNNELKKDYEQRLCFTVREINAVDHNVRTGAQRKRRARSVRPISVVKRHRIKPRQPSPAILCKHYYSPLSECGSNVHTTVRTVPAYLRVNKGVNSENETHNENSTSQKVNIVSHEFKTQALETKSLPNWEVGTNEIITIHVRDCANTNNSIILDELREWSPFRVSRPKRSTYAFVAARRIPDSAVNGDRWVSRNELVAEPARYQHKKLSAKIMQMRNTDCNSMRLNCLGAGGEAETKKGVKGRRMTNNRSNCSLNAVSKAIMRTHNAQRNSDMTDATPSTAESAWRTIVDEETQGVPTDAPVLRSRVNTNTNVVNHAYT
jgi:hypothetical protein